TTVVGRSLRCSEVRVPSPSLSACEGRGTPTWSFLHARREYDRLRALSVLERGELYVEAVAAGHVPEQRTIHPVGQRAIELARPAEAVPVLVQTGGEDVLDLEQAFGMEERDRVDEAL